MTGQHIGRMRHRGAGGGIRERLLEAGLRSFEQWGFNGCGVQEITNLAGVPKGSFYNHFESKEALGAEVLDYYWLQRAAATLEILDDASLAPKERLRRYFIAKSDMLAERGFTCGSVLGNLATELSDHSRLIAERISAIFARWTSAVAACIRAAQAEGAVHSDMQAEALASVLLQAWEGAVMRARVEKDRRPLTEFIEVALERILG